MKEKQYNACIYARLSRDDGDKQESDSITSQKAMIREFLKKHPEIREVSEKVDDGYSGVNFERPAFQEMMEEIRDGKVNCVIVKDLSRFGRNYIEAGNYIEKIFPLMDVRFIAINDDYDSTEDRHSDSLIVPFKNLINDAYCKDISVKIRTQLEIKRKKGQYIGPGVVYGYRKDDKDRNHLVIDPYAAEVIRSLFKWVLTGMSPGRIADKLNDCGILCPMEYKISEGESVQTGFRTGYRAKWNHVSVRRILENEIYTGVLLQGKTGSPNHKIKKRFPKDPSDWIRVEGTHEAIIEKDTFERVRDAMKKDVRSSPGKECVYPLSGFLYCADCGESMVRKSVKAKGKEYAYYVCNKHRTGGECTSHAVKERDLLLSVQEIIRMRMDAILELENVLKRVELLPMRKKNMVKYDLQIRTLKEQIERSQKFKMKLYDSLLEGTIDRNEFASFKKNYDLRIKEDETAIKRIKKERESLLEKSEEDQRWIKTFLKYRDVDEISRSQIHHMIEKIVVYEDGRIDIVFRYEYEYQMFLQMLKESEDANGEEK